MHAMDNRGEVWKLIIILVPVLGATLIAVSRIVDHRHHPFDVVTGSMLGVFVAWISYRQYFPSIFEPWKKGRAYPIRSWGTKPTGPPVRLLAQSYDDTERLRNPDEERLSAEHDQRLSGGSLIGESVRADPHISEAHTHRRHRRNCNDAYSSSSSEDITDGFETNRPSRGPNIRGLGSPSPNGPYNMETVYDPAGEHSRTPEELAASYLANGQGRQLTSIAPTPEP